MKEIFKLERPQSVLDAAKAQKGFHIALELLIFVAVFLVSQVAMMVILLPGMIALMLFDKNFWAVTLSNDVQAISQYNEALMSSNGFVILMLFANAMMIVVALLFCKFLQKRKMNTLGFRKKGFVKEYLVGMVVGFVMFSAAILICTLTGSLSWKGLSPTFAWGTFLLFTVGYMIQGMAEEVLCRGYLMVSVGRRYAMPVAIMVNSLIFAGLHLLNSGVTVLAVVNLTLFGVLASVYYIKRDNIWGIGAVHSVWNLVQGNVYGIKVSGMESSCTVFASEVIEGKEWMNGGAFGLEGGVAVTIVQVIAIVILLCMKGKSQKQSE